MPRKFSYNKPLTIQKYTGGTDAAYNSEDRTKETNWSDFWQGFCREIPTGSYEYFRSARLDERIDRILHTRWNPTIVDNVNTRDYRVKFDGKTQYITSVLDTAGDDREIEIGCTEFVD